MSSPATAKQLECTMGRSNLGALAAAGCWE
jgi:hypothetical protein